MQKSEKYSIIKQLPPEVWKIIFSDFSTKELWKTCSTSRYWSYLIINTLVSRLKKKPMDICKFYGDFLQPSKEPYITCIPFNSSYMNFSYDDYLIHIKQPQPIILGKWVSRSVGFVPWCQQESNKKNTNDLNHYNNKNNLKYYAEKPPTIYCWFCSPYNVDKEIAESGNISSMYDLPKAENCLLSNINYYYPSIDRNYFYSSYSRSNYYYNTNNDNNDSYNSSSTYLIPSYNHSSSGRYQNNFYNQNNNDDDGHNNRYYSSDLNKSSQSYQYQYYQEYQEQNINNEEVKYKNFKSNDNKNVDIYEISIGKGMARLKYELVNVEENPLNKLSSSPTDSYHLSSFCNKDKAININNKNNNYHNGINNSNFKSSSPKNSSKCVEGNCQMSINDFVGNINYNYNVASPKNPQGNYSNLIMDYYNPNLLTYSNMNYDKNNYKKSDTIIEVKIIELVIHPSAIFS